MKNEIIKQCKTNEPESEIKRTRIRDPENDPESESQKTIQNQEPENEPELESQKTIQNHESENDPESESSTQKKRSKNFFSGLRPKPRQGSAAPCNPQPTHRRVGSTKTVNEIKI